MIQRCAFFCLAVPQLDDFVNVGRIPWKTNSSCIMMLRCPEPKGDADVIRALFGDRCSPTIDEQMDRDLGTN